MCVFVRVQRASSAQDLPSTPRFFSVSQVGLCVSYLLCFFIVGH